MTLRSFSLLASFALVALPFAAAAENPKNAKSSAASATARPVAAKPGSATPAPSATAETAAPGSTTITGTKKLKNAPLGVRHLPGRVIIGQILNIDETGKKLRVKSLRGEEFDLVLGSKTEVPVETPLAVGKTIRTRFDEIDGQLVPFFVRILDTPEERWEKKKALTASAAAPASAATASGPR